MQTRYAYCIYCKYEQEKNVMRFLNRIVPECKVINPMLHKKMKQNGEIIHSVKPLFPQYLFLYSEKPLGKWLHDQYPKGIERWLGRRDHDYELSGTDLDLALTIFAYSGVVDEQTARSLKPLIKTECYSGK